MLKMILGNNVAIIGVIIVPAYVRLSRHLKYRIWKLMDLIEEEDWSLRHLLGILLAADGFTKLLARFGSRNIGREWA